MGEARALNGSPWMVTLGLCEAGTAQRNGLTAAREIYVASVHGHNEHHRDSRRETALGSKGVG